MPLVKTRILESITAWAHASHALEVPREMSLVEVVEFLRQRGQVHIGADTESRQRILKAEASNQPFRRNAERTLANVLDGTDREPNRVGEPQFGDNLSIIFGELDNLARLQ